LIPAASVAAIAAVIFGLWSGTHVQAAESDEPAALQAVIDDHWRWWLSVHPFEATALGVRSYDTEVPDLSLEAADRAADQSRKFLERLRAIPDRALPEEGRVNKTVLSWMLSEDIVANGFGERMMLFTSYESWPQDFAGLPDMLPFYTRADYESYLTRLSKYPRLNGQAMAITARALKEGYVQPCSTLEGFAKTISGAVAGKPEATRFYQPFLRAKPAAISDADWIALKARVATIIRDTLTPEYMRFHAWFLAQYLPACRRSDSASTLPDGVAWYASQVKAHTTTDLTPAQIHQIGLEEVARITARMDEVAKQAHAASRQEFIREIKTNPKYFAKSAQELLDVAAWEAKKHDALMPRYFGLLPRLPYGVRAIPAETAEGTTTAYYFQGSPASGIAGTFYVNTSKLDQRPLWELPVLSAHEAVPGHHQQIALQQELKLPEFRRNATSFTAYVEGWALYSEFLGEEMGLYDTPEKMMGRLSYEAWRASRLVVDTGIHAMGWNKAKAVAFMKENTALTDANIDAEVNRYISWPGQALGYKIGEIRIRELRAKAERTLGPKFDLRAFHDAVLSSGPVPLDELTGGIDRWIATHKN
jgi:uncharacterized protein (DUF885 family)